MVQQSGLRANISQSFSESIPFIASGNYVYDTLDFLTTPFLYSEQKSDAVSLKFTRRNEISGNKDREEGLFGAARVSIFSIPIYWAVNLIGTNTTANVDPPISQAAIAIETETNVTNYRFMLGSHFKKLGFAGYIIHSQDRTRARQRNPNSQTVTETYNSESETVDFLYQPRGNHYGIELGQSSLPIPMAWTLNVEYRMTGGQSSRRSGSEDNPSVRNKFGAPGTIFDPDLIPKFGETIGVVSSRNGNNRREIRSNFLGWYTLIQKKLNVGFSYSLAVPFGSGKNTNLEFADENSNFNNILSEENFAPSEETPRSTKLSGYDISVTIFADNDFNFGSIKLANQETNAGTSSSFPKSVFRITPSITYRNLRDKIFYNEGHNLLGTYEYLSLDLNFRVQIGLGQRENMFLYLGWLPKVIFIQRYHTTTRASYRRQVDLANPIEIKREQRLESPRISFADFGIGFSYLFFSRLKLNLAFSPTSSGNQIDSTRFDLGIDYTF